MILGNPPYNAFAGVSPQEEGGLVEPYKVGLNTEWGIKKFNLDDLYIRFFRLAERRIAEMTGKGVVCYISNFSYLGDPSFVVMRHRFLGEFDALWFDCLNGDSRETGKLTPGRQARSERLLDRIQPRGHPRRHGHRADGAQGEARRAAGRALPALLGRHQARRPAGEPG